MRNASNGAPRQVRARRRRSGGRRRSPEHTRRLAMAHWLDDLAKRMTARTSRRGALKVFAAGVGNLVVAPRAARAQTINSPAQAGTITYPAGWNLVAGP